MSFFYLLRPDGTFSDAADYAETPTTREDGDWVAGEPTGLQVFSEDPTKQLSDGLETLFFSHFTPAREAALLTADQMMDLLDFKARLSGAAIKILTPVEYAAAVKTKVQAYPNLPACMNALRDQIVAACDGVTGGA